MTPEAKAIDANGNEVYRLNW